MRTLLFSIFILAAFLPLSGFAQSQRDIEQEQARKMGLDCVPQFEGGVDSLLSYISNNVHYPDSAIMLGLEGRAMVVFIVDRDGSCHEAQVVSKVHPLLAEEAKRVILSMPKWKPATKNGIPVRVKYNIPINFKLPIHLKDE